MYVIAWQAMTVSEVEISLKINLFGSEYVNVIPVTESADNDSWFYRHGTF